jgi:hypothetical protein
MKVRGIFGFVEIKSAPNRPTFIPLLDPARLYKFFYLFCLLALMELVSINILKIQKIL